MIRINQIRASGQPAEKATLDSPLDHLVACHSRISDRLDTLEKIGNHIESNHDEALASLHSVFRFLDSNGAWHTEDEERSLFPRLLPRLSADDLAYIQALEHEHTEAEQAYARLKEYVSRGAPDAARYQELAAALVAIYRAHIASENARLIPLGRQALDEADLHAIAGEMKARRGLDHE